VSQAAGPASRAALSIVQLVDNLNAGGLERLAIDLGVAHRAAGHASAIFCLGEAGALAGQARERGLDVEAFDKPPGVHLPTLWKLARALRRRGRVDVMHAHNPGNHHYAVAAAKLAGVPVVINSRHGVSASSGKRYNERYFKLALPWTDKVVYVSGDSERYYTGAGIVPASQGVTILNGTPLGPFLLAPRVAAPDGRVRLVTLGRLVPVKGHAILLAAFAELLRTVPNAELRIYGGGELHSQLEGEIARLGLSGRAFLPGETRDVAQVLAEADVFVFSSLSEGLPIVILEALASGLPVVSTRVGGVPEVAPEGDVAWYCEPGDASALAAVLRQALADRDELRRRGGRARVLAQEKYSIDVCQRGYEDLCRRLLAAKGRG
jgi:glycosyltransferase involved in cell wall biosynthesis